MTYCVFLNLYHDEKCIHICITQVEPLTEIQSPLINKYFAYWVA